MAAAHRCMCHTMKHLQYQHQRISACPAATPGTCALRKMENHTAAPLSWGPAGGSRRLRRRRRPRRPAAPGTTGSPRPAARRPRCRRCRRHWPSPGAAPPAVAGSEPAPSLGCPAHDLHALGLGLRRQAQQGPVNCADSRFACSGGVHVQRGTERRQKCRQAKPGLRAPPT